jgi:hypothetical protein
LTYFFPLSGEKIDLGNKSWQVEAFRSSKESLFNSNGPHKTALLLCDSGFDGKYYSKPVTPGCDFRIQQSQSTPKPVNVTFWVLDNNADQLKGHHCFAKKMYRMKFYEGIYARGWDKDRAFKVTAAQCREMVNMNMTCQNFLIV